MGRPPEEPEQPLTENSLLEVLDGAIMMYNLSVHQQLGKVSRHWPTRMLCGSVCLDACVCAPPCAHVSPGVPGRDCAR